MTKIQPPKNGINERALLVDLSIGYWEGRKRDRKVGQEVTINKGADADAGSWWTRTIPKAAVAPVLAARLAARTLHFKYTLPWWDEGSRVLPAAAFLEYTAELRKAEGAYRGAVENFLREYPKIVQAAQVRLGKLFRAEAFPPVDELRHRYPWQVRISPIPVGADFRVDLGDEATKDIQDSIQKQAETAFADAVGDLWQRLHAVVEKVVERLSDPEAVFRDSLILNVIELTDLLPRLNVTGDPNLESLRQEVVSRIANQSRDVLRYNKSVRADTAKAANDILAKLAAYAPKK